MGALDDDLYRSVALGILGSDGVAQQRKALVVRMIIRIAYAMLAIYVLGFGLTFFFHLFYLQMVTPPLALLRALLWPLFWFFGIPRGTPLPMD